MIEFVQGFWYHEYIRRKEGGDAMKFSHLPYERPDYAMVKTRLRQYRAQIREAGDYEKLRDVWLDSKREFEHMEYWEMIAYIRYLCGIDYEKNAGEVKIQGTEDPKIYALRDECCLLAGNSPYRAGLEAEFGKQIFAQLKEYASGDKEESLQLQREEAQLKMQYRRLMAAKERDEDALFAVFDRMIEIRRNLAVSQGYDSYIDLGYHIRGRKDYGRKDLESFRDQIQKSITPILADLKNTGIALTQFQARTEKTEDLIAAIGEMFRDLSRESGEYIEEMVRKELYDLETRPNKRHNAWTCCMLPHKKLPFVIGEYSGDGMETGAAVHEFGHGFAFYTAARTQRLYEFHRSTATVNEIHSKTMEHFMYPYLELFVGDKKREYMRNHLLQQLENLSYRCAIDEFEHMMYELPHRTRQQFCRLWAEISRKYMPWRTIDSQAVEEGKYWPHQTHLVEHPFYYIEYNIAQISTYEFHLRMQRDRDAAWADYLTLCRAGGSKSYRELLICANLSNPFEAGVSERICCPVVEELATLL